ncbi:hypothetical protein [Staphylococcus equorum]|uniref:hypothetical protein n=1 Tax=Staphylococcus equorum TaxID=246432 RepID=UPI0008539422|nr:hypothetical protein [Staphylococcus equorum]OEL08273.1 hypothetical protein AST04_08795 [Staphylococcus equorum]
MNDMVKKGIDRAKAQNKGYVKFQVLGDVELTIVKMELDLLESTYEVLREYSPQDEVSEELYVVLLDMHSIEQVTV